MHGEEAPVPANFRLDIATVFAILILLGLMGLGMTRLIELARMRVIFWDGS